MPDHTLPYGTVLLRDAIPGTSCQATISLSLRDKSYWPIEGYGIKFRLWALAWVYISNETCPEGQQKLGLVLGFAGASFAVALPQAGRWYPPNMRGAVMGLAGAGNIGVVLDSLVAPRISEAKGWKNVFGCALIPALLVLILYAMVSEL